MTHPVLPRGRELKLPLVSGVLLTVSFPPFHLLIPPFLALIPYLVFVARSPDDRAGSASVRRATFWMGILFYGTLLYWLFAALVYYTWLSLLGYLITIVVLSSFLAGAGWGIHLLRSRRGLPFWITVPVFWTTAEWLRGHLGDLSFPWLGLGNSLTGFPALVGFADLVGARGVTVWLAAVNGLLAEWWLVGWRRRWQLRALALALTVALPVAYSLLRWHTLELRPAARVLVVQPNIPEDLKLDRTAALDSSRTALENLTGPALAATPQVDLVVWPETALPTTLEAAPGWGRWAAESAAQHGIPLVFGYVDLQRFTGGEFDYYNAALVLNAEGRPLGSYRKHHLVPIVERVPYIPLAWIRGLRLRARDWELPLLGNIGGFLRWFGGFGQGEDEPVFPVDGRRFGVLICYESIFAGLSRQYRLAGADFLVNITNDAWFGREHPWWSRTSALHQHPAHLVMRAIENRVGVARAANTGISLFVDPRGRIYEATKLFEPDARAAVVQTTDGVTLYSRVGDWPGWLCVAGTTVLLGLAWRKRVGTAERS